jgi:hypothetical protein
MISHLCKPGGRELSDQIWPNFFIVGAVKCGTTSLWDYLQGHPQVFFPTLKEPYFFQSKLPDPRITTKLAYEYIGQQEEYLELFSSARGYAAVGEASPTYLYDEEASRKIKEACPNARIIIILRDPILRAHSHFLMHRRLGKEPIPNFYDALKADLAQLGQDSRYFGNRLYMEMGLYYKQTKRYIDTFGQERVSVLLLDDLSTNTSATMNKVTEHLGIEPFQTNHTWRSESNQFRMPRPGFRSAFRIAHRVLKNARVERAIPQIVNEWLRSSPFLYERRKPVLDVESRRLLEGFFEPDVAKLEDLLGRKLPELRKSWN